MKKPTPIIKGPEYSQDISIESFNSVEEFLTKYEVKAMIGTPVLAGFVEHWLDLLRANDCIGLYEYMLGNLLAMARGDKRRDETRAPFHIETDNGYKVKAIVRAYGESLNAMGGMGLMQAALFHLRMQPGFDDGSALEYSWKGIGDWQ